MHALALLINTERPTDRVLVGVPVLVRLRELPFSFSRTCARVVIRLAPPSPSLEWGVVACLVTVVNFSTIPLRCINIRSNVKEK